MLELLAEHTDSTTRHTRRNVQQNVEASSKSGKLNICLK